MRRRPARSLPRSLRTRLARGVPLEGLAISVVLLLPMIASDACAETFDLLYDASLGTLPSAQGWTYVDADPAPGDGLDESNYVVAGGILAQGPTGGTSGDLANLQSYQPPAFDYSFREDVLEVAIRLRVVQSSITLPGGGQPSSGFTLRVKDREARSVATLFGENEVYLGSTNSSASVVVSHDTTSGFTDYVMRVDANGATLSIDDEIVAALPYSNFAVGGAPNFLGIGDIWPTHEASVDIQSFRFSRVDPPEVVARDVSIVTVSVPSTSSVLVESEASGQAFCPSGTVALGGGVSIPSHTGPYDEIEVELSDPSIAGFAPSNSWLGSARAGIADPFNLEIHALCGEVPQHVLLNPLSQEVSATFPACPDGLIRIGGDGEEENFRPHTSCADDLGWLSVSESTPTNADTYKELTVVCPVETYLIGGSARTTGNPDVAIPESYPETIFTDQPVAWVAAARTDAGGATDPWSLEVTAWCAPKADPTETRPRTIARWRGAEFGVFDELGRHDGAFMNGAGSAPGLTGTAFEFERVNQEWIEIERTADFYPQGDFTVDAWIQTDDVDPNGVGHVIVEIYEFGGAPGPTEASYPNWWNLQLTPAGLLEGRVRRLNGTLGTIATGSVDLADGQPHHVAMQRSGGAIRLFVDGAEAAEALIQNSWDDQPFAPEPNKPADPVTIGGRRSFQAATTQDHWDGLIDDVKIHDRGLSEEELAEIAGCGLPLAPRVLNVDARRYGGRAAGRNETRLCVFLDAGSYEIELLTDASDPEARFTAWAEGFGMPWKTRIEVKPEVDADFGFGDASGAATAQDAYANTSPTTVPFVATTAQRFYFGIEEEGAVLDNRGGVSFRINPVPEPGFGVALALGAFLVAGRGAKRRAHR